MCRPLRRSRIGRRLPAAARRFRSWWEGQAADGFGESLEQRVIQTAEFGGILVHFWDDSDDWRIQTEMQQSSSDTGFEVEETFEVENEQTEELDMAMNG